MDLGLWYVIIKLSKLSEIFFQKSGQTVLTSDNSF